MKKETYERKKRRGDIKLEKYRSGVKCTEKQKTYDEDADKIVKTDVVEVTTSARIQKEIKHLEAGIKEMQNRVEYLKAFCVDVEATESSESANLITDITNGKN